MKTSPALGFGWLLLIVAVGIYVINMGPCDGLSKVGETVGKKLATDQMSERDARDAATKAEMVRLLKEQEAAKKSK